MRERESDGLEPSATQVLGHKFFELAEIAANARGGKNASPISPIALEAVKRIDALFDIEREINGLTAEERLRAAQRECCSSRRAGRLDVPSAPKFRAMRRLPRRSTRCSRAKEPSPDSDHDTNNSLLSLATWPTV